jgi:hypothetical protein
MKAYSVGKKFSTNVLWCEKITKENRVFVEVCKLLSLREYLKFLFKLKPNQADFKNSFLT